MDNFNNQAILKIIKYCKCVYNQNNNMMLRIHSIKTSIYFKDKDFGLKIILQCLKSLKLSTNLN